MLDRLRELQQHAARAERRPRDRRRASPSTRWPIRMQTSVPERDGHLERAGVDLRRSTARTRARPARSRPTACWPAGWRSGACGSSSSITRAGTSTATCRATSAASARRRTAPARRSSPTCKQRGLLDDTLVVWGGEFGRTSYSQGKLTADNYGRDHHPRCFTVWMAGGGVKAGLAHGTTDDFGYNVVADPRPRARLPRHDPPPARHRSRAAHVLPPGPALPADRRARDGGEGPAQLTVCSRKPRSLSGLRTT